MSFVSRAIEKASRYLAAHNVTNGPRGRFTRLGQATPNDRTNDIVRSFIDNSSVWVPLFGAMPSPSDPSKTVMQMATESGSSSASPGEAWSRWRPGQWNVYSREVESVVREYATGTMKLDPAEADTIARTYADYYRTTAGRDRHAKSNAKRTKRYLRDGYDKERAERYVPRLQGVMELGGSRSHSFGYEWDGALEALKGEDAIFGGPGEDPTLRRYQDRMDDAWRRTAGSSAFEETTPSGRTQTSKAGLDAWDVAQQEIEQDFLDEASAGWKRIVENSRPAIQVQYNTLYDIIQTGQIGTMFDPDTVGSISSEDGRVPDWNKQERARKEARVFGISPDDTTTPRPVYGYLWDKDSALVMTDTQFSIDDPYANISGYGDVVMFPKESVKQRSTVTAQDFYREAAPTPYLNPTLASVRPVTQRLVQMIDGESPSDLMGYYGEYAEVQVHGGLKLDDIETIVFPFEPHKELRDALERRGIKVRRADPNPEWAEPGWHETDDPRFSEDQKFPIVKYDPNQPRDERGRWTRAGRRSSRPVNTTELHKPESGLDPDLPAAQAAAAGDITAYAARVHARTFDAEIPSFYEQQRLDREHNVAQAYREWTYWEGVAGIRAASQVMLGQRPTWGGDDEAPDVRLAPRRHLNDQFERDVKYSFEHGATELPIRPEDLPGLAENVTRWTAQAKALHFALSEKTSDNEVVMDLTPHGFGVEGVPNSPGITDVPLYRGIGGEESSPYFQQMVKMRPGDTFDLPLSAATPTRSVAEQFAAMASPEGFSSPEHSSRLTNTTAIIKFKRGTKVVTGDDPTFEAITAGRFKVTNVEMKDFGNQTYRVITVEQIGVWDFSDVDVLAKMRQFPSIPRLPRSEYQHSGIADLFAGNVGAHIYKYDPNQPRDERGRWTRAGRNTRFNTGTKPVTYSERAGHVKDRQGLAEEIEAEQYALQDSYEFGMGPIYKKHFLKDMQGSEYPEAKLVRNFEDSFQDSGLWAYFQPCREIRKAAIEQLGMEVGKEWGDQYAGDDTPTGFADYPEEWKDKPEIDPVITADAALRALSGEIGDTFRADFPLQRNMHMDTDDVVKLFGEPPTERYVEDVDDWVFTDPTPGEVRPGHTVDLPLVSTAPSALDYQFSENREWLAGFGTDVILRIAPGARTLPALFGAFQSQGLDDSDERITGGRFRVEKVEWLDRDDSGVTHSWRNDDMARANNDLDYTAVVYLEPLGAFDPDEKDKLVKEGHGIIPALWHATEGSVRRPRILEDPSATRQYQAPPAPIEKAYNEPVDNVFLNPRWQKDLGQRMVKIGEHELAPAAAKKVEAIFEAFTRTGLLGELIAEWQSDHYADQKTRLLTAAAGLNVSAREVEDALRLAFDHGANYTFDSWQARAKRLNVAFDIDLFAVNQHALEYARNHAAALVVDITEQQRRALQTLVQDSIVHGYGARELAKLVENTVGLHDRYAKAVVNYKNGLHKAGNLNPLQIDEAVAKYATRLRKSRARTIARTEILRAQNAGQTALWEQYAKQGLIDRNLVKRKWIITRDERLCPYCSKMVGDRAYSNVAGMFSTPVGMRFEPPMHPNCRCTMVLEVPDIDSLVLGDYPDERFTKADDLHQGVMISLDLPQDVAERLSVADGLPADELHITLSYLGDTSLWDDDNRDLLVEQLSYALQDVAPISGETEGIGSFSAGDHGVPWWVMPKVEGLRHLHNIVTDAVRSIGFEPRGKGAKNWLPHITLKYGGEVPPERPVEELSFSEVSVHFGDEIVRIPLGGVAKGRKKGAGGKLQEFDPKTGRYGTGALLDDVPVRAEEYRAASDLFAHRLNQTGKMPEGHEWKARTALLVDDWEADGGSGKKPVYQEERVAIDLWNDDVVVGTFQAHFETDPDSGKSYLWIEDVELSTSLQGHGVGREIVREARIFTEAYGLTEVKLMANISRGGYAWAKYGFLPGPEYEFGWGQLIDTLGMRLDAWDKGASDDRMGWHRDMKAAGWTDEDSKFVRGFIDRYNAGEWESPNVKDTWALVDHPKMASLFNGVSWYGSLDLTDPDTLSRFEKYMGA